MLLQRELAELRQVATVPTQMRVTIAEPGHQCPAAPVEDSHTGVLLQLGLVGHFADGRESLT